MRALLPRTDIQDRLALIFPRRAFDTALSSPVGAAAVAAMLYVDAVVPDTGQPASDVVWVRPTTCLWMSDEVYARQLPEDRVSWLRAALKQSGRRAVDKLQASWGLSHANAWYRDNTRENLRDDTFREWLIRGALREKAGVPGTSGKPRWALATSFADLFSPALSGDELTDAIDTWCETNLSPEEQSRSAAARQQEGAAHTVPVTLPGGINWNLKPGKASLILQGVLEQWMPARLDNPVVLSISQPRSKPYLADDAQLRELGLAVDALSILPHLVIVELGKHPPLFWIIEAVVTDGSVTQDRRRQLLRWAQDQRIPMGSCRFLSAFLDRNHQASKRRLKDLAPGSYAWYLSEPGHELSWYEINQHD